MRARAIATVATDPVDSAKAAGLRYVSGGPGIRRRRAGAGFVYVDAAGRRVRDPDTLARIRSLAIPPAWRDVWICPLAHGHLQAVGYDARGRKQYRYHERWRAQRDSTKYARMIAFGQALPRIRDRVERDLRHPGLPREKVLATADVSGSTVAFEFRGKGGKPVTAGVTDRRVARVVRRCQELPGQELFQYVDADGRRQTIDSADVNAYLKEISGDDFTAKDFRTWAGTVLAAQALRHAPASASQTQARRNVLRAIESVAGHLGNTPAICRKSYVHPAVIDAYLDGVVLARPEERAVLALLDQAA